MRKIFSFAKSLIMKIFFSKGRAMKIRRGHLKGYKYIVKAETGFSTILGNLEKQSQELYINSIFKDFIVFDLGANFGIHSMLYSKLVGENGMVYAFEPLPGNIEDLKTHFQLNQIKNIKIVEDAIADKKGTVEFKVAKHASQGSLIDFGSQTGELVHVSVNTLDDFCVSNNVYPDFLKIDIEGAEGMALKGYSEAVKKTYPFFAIELHTPECDKAAGEFFGTHGYEVFRLNEIKAQRMRKHDKLLEKVKHLDRTWPHLDGMWGVIWAVHPSRKATVQAFINDNV